MYADNYILYFNEDSCNEMGILNIDLNNINLDNNFDKDDPDPIILIKILTRHIKFEIRKAITKEISEVLMSIHEKDENRTKFY